VDVFTAVADPTRRRILDLLAERELPAGALVAAVPELTQPAVSRHLRVLRETGLVSSTPAGQQRIYRLERDGLDEIDLWIERTRRFWAPALDRLDAHVRESEPTVTDPERKPR
jgi:DNA-binding transcriptional ArsR family regulator